MKVRILEIRGVSSSFQYETLADIKINDPVVKTTGKKLTKKALYLYSIWMHKVIFLLSYKDINTNEIKEICVNIHKDYSRNAMYFASEEAWYVQFYTDIKISRY